MRADLDYATTAEWHADIARQYKLRLPRQGTAGGTGVLESWLRKAGVVRAAFLAAAGCPTLGAYVERNKGLSARELAGVVLEYRWECEYGFFANHKGLKWLNRAS